MIRQSVSSSAIRSVGYDASKRILEIQFTSFTTYRYRNVPESIYYGLMNASSKGTYFNRYIKDRFSYY